MALRVVLADDHPLFLQGLEVALEHEGLEIAGRAGSGYELLELMQDAEPDAVLLDLSMPGMDGVECLAALQRLCPEVRVVMLSASENDAMIDACLEAGAVCFVGKTVEPVDIAHAVRTVCGDLRIRYRSHAASPRPAAAAEAEAHLLTPREREILSVVAEGGSNGEIARGLWVTEQTVKFHLSNIYRKLEVRNRTQAAHRGWELGLIEGTRDTAVAAAD